MDAGPHAPQPPIGSPPNHVLAQYNNSDIAADAMLNGVGPAPPGFSLAPGGPSAAASSHSQPQPNAATLVMDYSTDFPELPPTQRGDAGGSMPAAPLSGRWGAKPIPTSRPIFASNITQMFHLPPDERSLTDSSAIPLGQKAQTEQSRCAGIAAKTGTVIELSESKDRTLTVMLTGKRQNVEAARKEVIQALQTQANREILIPKEHHRVLIGKEGKRLRDLEAESDCRIIIPPRDNPSSVIKVVGPREGIDRAHHQIQLLSDELSKMAQEHLAVPRMFYPWVRGPNDETIEHVRQETGARINMPPPTANSEIIVITGEKEGVFRAAAAIRQIVEDKQANSKAVTCKVNKAQHRYIIGPQRSGLADILRQTGVSVEVPPESADSDTVTLRGDPDQLGVALTLVYAKASSVISVEIACPRWLHKFVIGPRGQALKQVIGDAPKCQVDFDDENDLIALEGGPEAVKPAQDALTAVVEKMLREMCFNVVRVHPSYHRHIIGRSGSQIGKIKQETGVTINVPDEQTNSDEIRIEGSKEGVKKASAEIVEIAKRLENEKSRDILIEQRFHKQIIGAKGESIKTLRDEFPGVQFSFPEPGRKSDVVNLRGPKDEVDKCYKKLQAKDKELKENNFQVKIPIFKDFHKIIIGKGGGNIRKIRDDTDTRIDFPAEDAGEDNITITGKRANVEKAVVELQKIQTELANIVSVEMKIPCKIQTRFSWRLVADIAEQCGGVQIKFPPEKSNSEKVTIRGPRDDVTKAEQLLSDLVKDREKCGFEDSLKAKAEMHRFLIGRGGTKINKIRESNPSVRVLFPREQDTDQETVHLIGKKEEVADVKRQLQQIISELDQIVELSTTVEPKWHAHFVTRNAAVLREVQEQFGGCVISFPRRGVADSTVSIKGAKECVDGARARIAEIVADLEAQITMPVEIAQKHHGHLLSKRGARVQQISAKHDVHIKFPERSHGDKAENGSLSPTGTAPDESQPLPQNVVMITGRKEKCEAAIEALLEQVPVVETCSVPFEYHRNLIGTNGQTVRAIMEKHDVTITIPPNMAQSDEIQVEGAPGVIAGAVKDILARVADYELAAKDRELRNFELQMDVAPEFHTRLIGPKGRTITTMRNNFKVNIHVPQSNRASEGADDEPSAIVRIVGYEENALACKAEIERLVGEFQSLFTQEIPLDARIHPRLIGQKGHNIRKVRVAVGAPLVSTRRREQMMDEYGVDIRFPRTGDADPNLVTVEGRSEDAVYDCVDQLRNLEEEYLQDIVDRYVQPTRVTEAAARPPPSSAGVQIVNAPWQPPDVANMSEFPSMGGGAEQPVAAAGVWGARRF